MLIAKMLPNMKLHTSVFIPVVSEVTATPIAKAELEIKAIALSLLILLLFPIFNKRIADTATHGIAIYKGEVAPNAVAIVKTPNPTCDHPSPIILYLLSTKLTPRRAAHKLIKTPTNIAL